MFLAVFQEFSAPPSVLEAVRAVVSLDVATKPNTMATTDAEKEVVATNAKLMFDGASEAQVEDVLSKLASLGFTVTVRHPVTSAGCPMRDRVILRYSGTA